METSPQEPQWGMSIDAADARGVAIIGMPRE